MDENKWEDLERKPGPHFLSDIRYVTCIDCYGRLRENTMAAIWKLYTDGTLERVKYSDDIPRGPSNKLE